MNKQVTTEETTETEKPISFSIEFKGRDSFWVKASSISIENGFYVLSDKGKLLAIVAISEIILISVNYG